MGPPVKGLEKIENWWGVGARWVGGDCAGGGAESSPPPDSHIFFNIFSPRIIKR